MKIYRDRAGERYGRLVAVAPVRRRGKVYWKCRCDCGRNTVVFTGSLDSGATRSCGCLKAEARGGFKDIAGQRFGRLVAIKEAGQSVAGKIYWLCRCDCGKTAEIQGGCLRKGHTRSCGCLKAESKPFLSHGHAGKIEGKSATYLTWLSMRRRSNKLGLIPHDPRWDKFENFLADMGERPEGKTLDRKKNHLGYSKRNCRWASRVDQARNRDITKTLTFKGKTKSLSEWAGIVGLQYRTLAYRVHRGWTVRRALTTPLSGPAVRHPH